MSKSVDHTKDFPVSWEEMHRNSKALAWRLVDKGPWKGIIAVTRGGMVPACIVARELDLKLIETLCISSYDHKNQRGADILRKPAEAGDGKGWLVIDDLVDTGNTFKIARGFLPNARRRRKKGNCAGWDGALTGFTRSAKKLPTGIFYLR